MKFILFAFLIIAQAATAQNKQDRAIIAKLRQHITFLADDKLEGRRAGSPGEKLAYTYLSDQFRLNGLIPRGDSNTYIQTFEINEGKQINNATHFIINGNDLKIEKDFFPLIFSAEASVEATPAIAFTEKDMPWFLDMKELIEQNKNNPHFDLTEKIRSGADEAAQKGATAFIIYNSSEINDDLKFEGNKKGDAIKIPVIYVNKNAREKYLNDESVAIDIKLKVSIQDKITYGHNVIGWIDNKAANTVIIGAHYDHLGYGEDRNSLWTGTPQIHNGADDNASGVAAVIELSKMLKRSKLKNNNYLLICFSGEELGLYGSKYFTEHPTVDINAIDYMINLDMIGRLNDSSQFLSVGGYGTSPAWGSIFSAKQKAFSVKFDSSGVGPSDHTSFYRKNIPVLFFFTGTHSDYHKPTDDAEKINYKGELKIIKFIYSIIEQTNNKGKLAFEKTREQQMGSARFKVSLGIMPDYTFSGNGVRADGIVDGKIAQKVGIKAGDIIIELGDHKFSDVTSYMGVLGKFEKGDATKVKVLRGAEELTFDIVF